MKNSDVKIHVCILAAGASSRFGSSKQLQIIDAQPMVLHVFRTIEHSAIVNKQLVLGAHVENISKVIPTNLEVIVSERWQEGLSASIGAAVQKMDTGASHLMLALADQVAITRMEYAGLIDMCCQHPDAIIASKYSGKRGVPAIFPKSKAHMLERLVGDKGAGELLNSSAGVLEVEILNASIDIDTQADLRTFVSAE